MIWRIDGLDISYLWKKGGISGVGMDTDEILEGMMVVFARREARSAYRCAIR